MLHRFCLLFSVILFSIAAHASSEEEKPRVQAYLLNETQSIQPGHPMWVAIGLKIEENWHTYWKNPGDAGMPTVVEWDMPKGFAASPLIWPVPDKFSLETMVGFGYHDEVFFLAEITPPNDLPLSHPVQIKANVRWLVCSDTECVPGQNEVVISLPVSTEKPAINSENATIFSRARSQLPLKETEIQAFRKRDVIELQMSLPSQVQGQPLQAYFCPEEKHIIDDTVEVVMSPSQESSDKYHIVLKETADSQKAHTSTLKGVLVFTSTQDEPVPVHAVEIDSPILDKSLPQDLISLTDTRRTSDVAYTEVSLTNSPQGTEFEGGLGMALILAFIGGMILNLMPCVLPVVSFKVLSFVKMAGQKRSAIIKHGLAFFFGVLISFWILAGILLMLQAYGSSVGWGFQLQEPLFVAALAAFLLVFGLSLFGVFEMGTRLTSLAGNAQHRMKAEGAVSSFFSGILATVVATPCTGPLLGTAIGFAATLSPWESMSIFTSMGVGMALPYLILSFFPSTLRFLPKPGPWMETFKEMMGFLMIGTVLWLIWVFGAQTDNNAVVMMLGGFLLLGLGCWCYGKWGSAVKKISSRIFGIFSAVVFMSLGSYVIYLSAQNNDVQFISDASDVKVAKITKWEVFSPEKVAEYQQKGIPVLIDFTAKWCLICQANHMVFESTDVESKLSELGVVKMKADWTRNDPIITQELRKFGRSGVPLYVLYTRDPAQPPAILPQVLTPTIVLEALKAVE